MNNYIECSVLRNDNDALSRILSCLHVENRLTSVLQAVGDVLYVLDLSGCEALRHDIVELSRVLGRESANQKTEDPELLLEDVAKVVNRHRLAIVVRNLSADLDDVAEPYRPMK